ncbi:hypothetical protein [Streptomyces scabiei]|uniref:hypothetical protein n=1 Tax=Streptomyces scabiei TaxID=1930 RepID=UPI0004E7BEDB|nr:hypothetical protein [Streptomyces scabiei]KFG08108.1 hypothetical protein IQ61_15305 [Streptomyces scabiei]MDX3681373.1 hypothetical protein [Streptomyces scabiei]
MAIYQRGAGAHVAERVQPEPGSAEEERLEELVAKGEGGWHRVAEAEPEEPEQQEEKEPTPAPPPPAAPEPAPEPVPERPAKSANKAEWVAYAQAVAPETGGLDELTKDQLIELYGGDS